MSRFMRKIFVFASMVVLCCVLVGCGNNETASTTTGSEAAISEEYQAIFAGTWEMVAMSDGADVLTVEGVDESMRESIAVIAQFSEDGSLVFKTPGREMTGTWEPTAVDKVTLHMDPTEDFPEIPDYTGTLEDDTLAIDENGLVMLLKKTA